MSNSADNNIVSGCHVCDVVTGSLTLHRWIGGENNLTDRFLSKKPLQLVQSQLARTNTIEGRQMPHENEIKPSIASRKFDGENIRRRFNHAKQGIITLRIAANFTDIEFREIATPLTLLHAGKCIQ